MNISDYQDKIVALVEQMESEFDCTVAEINVMRGAPETSYNGDNLEVTSPVVVSFTLV